MMRRIAYCLYGQPRRVDDGYKCISRFIERQDPTIKIDFFYHTWDYPVTDGIYYERSPWRTMPVSDLIVKSGIIYHINELYRPIASVIDKPISFQPTDKLLTSLCVLKSGEVKCNISNSLSQLYSRQRVRDLLLKYELDNNFKYDLVVTSRFDFLKDITFDLNNADAEYVYFSDIHLPRKIWVDNFYVFSSDNFKLIFNTFSNLQYIINNIDVCNKIESIGEYFWFSSENILLSNWLYCGGTLEALRPSPYIPNFV